MYRKKSLTNFILLVLEKAVDGTVRFNDFAQNSFYTYGSGWEYPLKKSELAQSFKRLREKGLIDFIDDEKLVIRLTDAGKDKAVLVKLSLGTEKWDGKWRVVIFDIPEKRRIARDLLRYKLKEWGFVRWQNSVWVTKKNCTEVLKKFIRQVGIQDWVKVLEAKDIEI